MVPFKVKAFADLAVDHVRVHVASALASGAANAARGLRTGRH
jgi:hypothetical protein